MTVTYPATLSFRRLLLLWRGSIYKSVWKELLVYMVLHVSILLTYRFALGDEHQKQFEMIVTHVKEWTRLIPLSFLLGFFVNFITSRWWNVFNSIPWPDQFLVLVAATIPGDDVETRKIRRTIARYVNLHCVLIWKEICVKLKRRFPTMDHLVDAGFMTKDELKRYNGYTGQFGKWFVPVMWNMNIFKGLFKDKKLDSPTYRALIGELMAIRSSNGGLAVYDWVSAPLRYCQVATLATYCYFAMCLIARQGIEQNIPGLGVLDMYFPVVSAIEFLFYVGWLKVAEEYRFPFGVDDDDFDMNYILDRNFHIAFMLVDELAEEVPDITEDKYFRDRQPHLPHTKASITCRDRIPMWSLAHETVKERDTETLPPHNHYEEDPPGMVVRHRLRTRTLQEKNTKRQSARKAKGQQKSVEDGKGLDRDATGLTALVDAEETFAQKAEIARMIDEDGDGDDLM